MNVPAESTSDVGVVAGVWRYPVKSLQGEQLTAARIDLTGLSGDRRWGIRDDATGRILTARREPRLLAAAATLDADGPVVVLPDGATLLGQGAVTDAGLRDWLGRPVTLVAADGAAGARAEFFADATDNTERGGRMDHAGRSIRRCHAVAAVDHGQYSGGITALSGRGVGCPKVPAEPPDRHRWRRLGRSRVVRAADPHRRCRAATATTACAARWSLAHNPDLSAISTSTEPSHATTTATSASGAPSEPAARSAQATTSRPGSWRNGIRRLQTRRAGRIPRGCGARSSTADKQDGCRWLPQAGRRRQGLSSCSRRGSSAISPLGQPCSRAVARSAGGPHAGR